MPLIPTILQSELESVFEERLDAAKAPNAWAGAIFNYASQQVVPPVPPSVHLQARIAAAAALVGMHKPGAMLAKLPTALTTYAAVVAAGAGQVNFVAVPPPVPYILAPRLFPNTQIAARTIATEIDLWFRTGTAGPIPPAVPALPWS